MHTSRGIGVEAWVYVETGCEVETEVERTQVRFEFGHSTSSLNLCVAAPMLEQFVAAGAAALREWQERFELDPTGPVRERPNATGVAGHGSLSGMGSRASATSGAR